MKRTINSFHDGRTGSAITLALKYGAEATKVVKIEADGTINIDLMNALPGKDADKELMKFLVKALKVKESDLEVLAGSEEKKLISIMDVSPDEVDEVMHGLV